MLIFTLWIIIIITTDPPFLMHWRNLCPHCQRLRFDSQNKYILTKSVTILFACHINYYHSILFFVKLTVVPINKCTQTALQASLGSCFSLPSTVLLHQFCICKYVTGCVLFIKALSNSKFSYIEPNLCLHIVNMAMSLSSSNNSIQ